MGVPPSLVQNAIDQLQLPEQVHLHHERQLRGQVSGVKVDIHCHENASPTPAHSHDPTHTHDHEHSHHPHPHTHHHGRSYQDIAHLIQHSTLDPFIKEHALSIFQRIGVVEAAIHAKTLEEIHFHEIGALDSIADIVGACAALHSLQVGQVLASPPGRGNRHAHLRPRCLPHPRPRHPGSAPKCRSHPHPNPSAPRTHHPHWCRHPGRVRFLLRPHATIPNRKNRLGSRFTRTPRSPQRSPRPSRPNSRGRPLLLGTGSCRGFGNQSGRLPRRGSGLFE
ncbi:MAG: DUF111 family protein [Blastochloris sp.]|nr:DUF111 family protein [Blastochloris sp.]